MFRLKVHRLLSRISKNVSTLRYIAKHEGQGANHKNFQGEKDYLQRIDKSFFSSTICTKRLFTKLLKENKCQHMFYSQLSYLTRVKAKIKHFQTKTDELT